MNQPRVLQVALSLDPGGTEQLILDLAKRLHSDIPTMVCCLDEPGAWASKLTDAGIEVHALGRRPGFRPGLGRGVARIAARHRATTIHAHHYSPAVYSCLARVWQPSLRVVFTEHGRLSDAAPSGKRRLVNRLMARVPDAVYAVSEDVKQHLVGEGFRSEDVGVIYNGIDVGELPAPEVRAAVRTELGVASDTVVVGSIARLNPVKDFGTLLRAVALLIPRRRLRLVIVGDGDERGRLESLADSLGIASSTTFLGHREDARRWLAGCDVYVNSSISEGVSLTILEAMAAGLPVVATSVGGTPEVIDASCGKLVAPKQPDALARAIDDLAIDPVARATLGQAARLRVETRFTLDRMVQEYAAVYRSTINPPL